MTVEQILEVIDRATEPAAMSRGQALETLEQLSTGLESRIEGLRDDMRAAGQDWG